MIENVLTERLQRIVSHKAGSIDKLYLRHVVAEETTEPVLAVEAGQVGRLVVHSVAGADVASVSGSGAITSREDI